MKRIAFLMFLCVAAFFACGDAAEDDGYSPPDYDVPKGKVRLPDGGLADIATDAEAEEGDAGPCLTTFRYTPPAGRLVKSALVSGEWDGFAKPGTAMTGPDESGAFTATLELPIGLAAYKLVLDGTYELDPGAHLRKYVGGVENSAVRVTDCHVPTLSLKLQKMTRAGAGTGTYSVDVQFRKGTGGGAIDAATVKAKLRRDSVDGLQIATVDATKGTIHVDVKNLADGKYTLLVEGSDAKGREAKPLRLVFWIEAETYAWKDAVLYMAMTDRFKNGNPGNDAPRTASVDLRADYRGGDLEGIRQKIADGTLDGLGVRALWLSPFPTNPTKPYDADDKVHQVTSYHGYWPVKAREVDARLGGEAALKAVVKEAHAHGIRVLADYVLNHVHEDHEYKKAHPEWFRTGCVCGTENCDWTARRLDCMFAPYLPDVNWQVPEASDQFAEDAVWWIDTFDLDGLRVDAVKHVEDSAVMNLSTRVREEFEASGLRLFLTGETAMGWSDCGVECNQNDYGTIKRYIGPWALDGQFDFVLHHAVPYRAFAYDEKDLLHVDFWTKQSLLQYGDDAVMTAYVGSHDTSRFTTLASYRGQDGAHDRGIPGNKWDNVAAAPPDSESYARHRLALGWLFGIPGAPLLYYGDEYGEWGGSDPNNRALWRGDAALAGEEAATLAYVKKLGKARRDLSPLRRGDYRSVYATKDVLVFARKDTTGVALVALNRTGSVQPVSFALPATLGVANGAVLTDRIGGGTAAVAGGGVTLSVPSRSAMILAP